jgi:hypothetical protein
MFRDIVLANDPREIERYVSMEPAGELSSPGYFLSGVE